MSTASESWISADLQVALRRKTAYHEAGHAVMFQALGVDVVSIGILRDDDDANGRCRYRFESFNRLRPRLRALPAVAGDVATALDGFETLDEVADTYIDAYWDDDLADVLGTDWPRVQVALEVANEPEAAARAIVRAAARILRWHWSDVESLATRLLAEGVVVLDGGNDDKE